MAKETETAEAETPTEKPAVEVLDPVPVAGPEKIEDAAGREIEVYDPAAHGEHTQAMAPVKGAPQIVFNSEQMEIIRDQIAPDCTDGEIAFFVAYSKRVGLDPIARQIYAIRRKTRKKTESGQWVDDYRMTIQTSIDGLRLIAQRTGDYAGRRGPEWCGPDGVWKDVWLSETPPAAGRVAVLKHGFVEPLMATAHWREYVPTNQQGKPTGLWEKMPSGQLAKCAEALALRSAFPAELSGIYTDDEMAQADRAERRDTDPTGGTTGMGGSSRQREQVQERKVGHPESVQQAVTILESHGINFPMDWVKEAMEARFPGVEVEKYGDLTDEQKKWVWTVLVGVTDWLEDHYDEIDTPIGAFATIEDTRNAFAAATDGLVLEGPVEKIEQKKEEFADWIFTRQVELGLRNEDGTWTPLGIEKYQIPDDVVAAAQDAADTAAAAHAEAHLDMDGNEIEFGEPGDASGT